MSTRWLDNNEQRAWRGLRSMIMKLDGALASRLAAQSDLSLQDYGLLVVLTEQPDHRMRPSVLAEELGWERSRLSHHVGRMEKRGLVRKELCPEDGRGSFVAATAAGLAAIEAAAPGHVAAVRELFVDQLSPEQLRHLAGLSEDVLRGFPG